MPPEEYERMRDQSNERKLRSSRSVRDIGSPPERVDVKRWKKSCKQFRHFLESYFPEAFPLAWSPDHLRVIEKMETCVLQGGQFALAMPRGSGKTSLSERLALWAILTGRCRFVCLIGATEQAAIQLLDAIKTEVTYNELLFEDFGPELHGFPQLEEEAKKAGGQLCEGEKTRIGWNAKQLIFPANSKTKSGESIVTVRGITGAIRGQKHTLRTGEIVRPSLVILDDPQTKESARSPSQSAQRAEIIAGDVMGMAGPNQPISAVMPCTVIAPGDMADQILDREKNPLWRGERTKMVNAWPVNEDLWEKYWEIRQEDIRAGGDGSPATEYYRKNRKKMDEGAVVAWPERKFDNELSAIQHAQNLKYRNPLAMAAEYQNDPQDPESSELPMPNEDDICKRANGLRRGVLPTEAEYLTAFIDVHDNLLYFSVVAWVNDFTGWIMDYGTFPKQSGGHFTLLNCRNPMSKVFPNLATEAVITKGLEALTESICGREWLREDGVILPMTRCLIDAGYKPGEVSNVCRKSPYRHVLTPSRGVGIKATSKPMREYHRNPGSRFQKGKDPRWYLNRSQSRQIGELRFDTNHFKSFAIQRLTVDAASKTAVTVWGKPSSGHKHLHFAQHLVGEKPKRVTAQNSLQSRTIDEWFAQPGKENHWFDCYVGCVVAASFSGCELPIDKPKRTKSKKSIQRNRHRRNRPSGPDGRSFFATDR